MTAVMGRLRHLLMAAVLLTSVICHVTFRAVAAQDKAGLEEFREAVQANPEEAKSHLNLGVALARQGQIEEAIAEFREAIRIKPDYAEAHSSLGVALGEQGKWSAAIAQHREAIRINPTYAKAHYNLGVALGIQGNSTRQLPSIARRFASTRI